MAIFVCIIIIHKHKLFHSDYYFCNQTSSEPENNGDVYKCSAAVIDHTLLHVLQGPSFAWHSSQVKLLPVSMSRK